MTTAARPCNGYAAFAKGQALEPFAFERRALRPEDVAVRIDYCGVCHSDVHAVRLGRGRAAFPLVPGHEIVGDVVDVGSAVSQFRIGDKVAIGTVVDSCRQCPPCQADLEQYCQEYPTTTYNGVDQIDGTSTRGGYSTGYVAHEDFVYHLPAGLDPARAAPLLCAGATSYSPMRRWGAGPGKIVGVIGLGGLGHMGLKFARAMGAHVALFTHSPHKVADGYALGAHEVILSSDEQAMAAQAWRFDFILDTVSERHPLTPYLRALKVDGTLCSLGAPADGVDFLPGALTYGRKSLSGSGVAGRRETREMLEFCAANGLAADVEIIRMDEINHAFDRLDRGEVKYRFVIDMRTLETWG